MVLTALTAWYNITIERKLTKGPKMIKPVWKVNYHFNGFEAPIAISATEQELIEYMESELGYKYGYRAMTNEEITAWKNCHLKIYMA